MSVYIHKTELRKGIRNCRIESFEGISLITKNFAARKELLHELTKKSTSRTLRISFFSVNGKNEK